MVCFVMPWLIFKYEITKCFRRETFFTLMEVPLCLLALIPGNKVISAIVFKYVLVH